LFAVSHELSSNNSGTNQVTRLLFVEDDSVYFNLLERLLQTVEDPKFEILWAATVEHALVNLQEQEVDVILLDLNLPDSEGIETFQRIQRHAVRIPIIVLSGSNDEKQAMETVRLGAQDFLIKGQVGVQSLVRCVRYTLARFEVAEYRERIQAINDFTAALAHDLRGPIIGAERLLAAMLSNENSSFSRDDLSMLKLLQSNNEFLRGKVDSLLQVYRLESDLKNLNLESVDMSSLVRNCVRRFAVPGNKVKPKIAFLDASAFEVGGLEVAGNRTALNQLCTNLLDNAVKFSTPGDPIEVSCVRNNDCVELSVKDVGQGIAPDDLKSLFRKFWRGGSHTFVPGTGLGLYLCEKIVSAHHGSITCASRLGEGSTFTVNLPVAH
jgi:two-component system sensor histidine kinase/response regulator